MGSSSTARAPPDWRHDVFVSYRGEDTRKGFASHLFQALKQAGIRCYRDIERQERGQAIGPMLARAIRDSQIAIVIFSANYADSKWCLQELVEILECNEMYRDHDHMVIPIFYDVKPSEVQSQSGKFGKGFKRCRPRDKKEKEAWRAALEEAGNILPRHVDSDARDGAEFIELIVQDLSNRVFYFHSPYYTINATGLDQNVDHLISLLDIQNNKVLMIGICGMEGIGKTTIAKAVCRRLYEDFQEGVSLLEDIQHADDEHKLVKLQRQLLRNVLRIRHVMSLSDRRTNNISVIRSRLYQKKILLVLDNLDNKEQAYSIIGKHDFLGPGSRILVTTRDEQLLDDLRVDKKFMVPGLNQQDSLRLFCHHAFAQCNPREGYEELSKNLVHYVGGIPLAIETFASLLSRKMMDELHQILKKLIKSPHLDSLGVYLRSRTSLHSFKHVGPYGGSGDQYDDNAHTSVRKILVFAERVIHSIIIEYDHDGSLVRSNVHGKLDPLNITSHMVALDYPNEFLISVSGYIAEDYGFRVIRSLRFQSNKRLYGPFGEETGTYFTIPTVDNGRIIGFFGNCDNEFIDSIGAYFGPIPYPYPFNSLRPIDGKGKTWDDKKHMGIRQIDVVFSSEIESISVIYDNYGHPLDPITHGTNAGGQKHTVKLDYPYEYLTAISGYTSKVSGTVRVRSLTFHSNRRNYGSFGQETGMHFPAQWSGGNIVGFFGTTEDSHLRSIRAHLEPVSHIHPRKDAGPFGGECGRHWDDENLGSIKRIVITWGEVIHSIKCIYEIDGIIKEGITHGGNGGSNESTIELRCPDEYIHMMSGNYKEVDGDVVIVSLTFRSNLGTYGPYGGQETTNTTYFRTPWNLGMINGFFGRSGAFLNSVGAHFAPIYHKLPLKVIGPFGDDNGNQWDDGVHSGVRKIIGGKWDDKKHSGVREINLRYGYVIDSINCVYDDGGDIVKGSSHGGNGGDKTVAIKLDYPNEYVKSMSGHIGQLEHYMCIRSLTFKTNRATYGPYGREVGTLFSFESNNSKIVGFFGSSLIYLHSIGTHVEVLS